MLRLSAVAIAAVGSVVVSALPSVSPEPTSWERYLFQPTPENAVRVTAREYSEPRSLSDQEWDLLACTDGIRSPIPIESGQ